MELHSANTKDIPSSIQIHCWPGSGDPASPASLSSKPPRYILGPERVVFLSGSFQLPSAAICGNGHPGQRKLNLDTRISSGSVQGARLGAEDYSGLISGRQHSLPWSCHIKHGLSSIIFRRVWHSAGCLSLNCWIRKRSLK